MSAGRPGTGCETSAQPGSANTTPDNASSASIGGRFPLRTSEGREILRLKDRIHKAGEIRHLLREGKRRRTSHLDVYYEGTSLPRPRLGIIVPKHGHKIVQRNLLKRRLREIGRSEVLPGLRRRVLKQDLLVRARREAYEATYETLRGELKTVTQELCSEEPYSR